MDVSFLQLCAAPERQWALLEQCVNDSARRGRSYEFESCLLPPGCTPERVKVGFSRQRDGTYLLYFRPAVDYRGESGVLAALFRRTVWRFESFPFLSERMGSLARSLCCPGAARDDPWPPLHRALSRELGRHVLGQERAVEAVSFRLAAHLGKRAPLRPLSLVLHGPTGVGKSELGKAIAPALARCCGRQYHFVWVDLNSYTHPHSVHRLTGAPPGYVGYEDPSPFEAVRQHPCTVFMLDELEKAHPEVLKAFMPILDEGRCTARRPDDAGERELDFRRCILVFTTNLPLFSAGGRLLGFVSREETAAAEPETKKAAAPEELARQLYASNERARQAMVRQGVLPEIAGRFTGFVGFQPLDTAARAAILQKQIIALGLEYGLSIVQVDPETVLALSCGQGALSARSQVCVLEGMLCPLLSQAAAEGLQRLRLTGRPGRLRLLSQPLTGSSSSTVPLTASS